MLCASTLNGNDLSCGTCISSLVLLCLFRVISIFFSLSFFWWGWGEGAGSLKGKETSRRFIAASYIALLCLGGCERDKVSFSSLFFFSFFSSSSFSFFLSVFLSPPCVRFRAISVSLKKDTNNPPLPPPPSLSLSLCSVCSIWSRFCFFK